MITDRIRVFLFGITVLGLINPSKALKSIGLVMKNEHWL
jgi:hypothetical protein